MQPTRELRVTETVGPVRLAARVAGVLAVALVLAAFISTAQGLYDAAFLTAPPGWTGGWRGLAARFPLVAFPLALLLSVGLSLAAVWLGQRPLRRHLVIDRQSVLVVTGRRVRRHRLTEAALARPNSLTVAGRRYRLTPDDFERVAGLLSVAVPPRSRQARAMAVSNPTVLERGRRVRAGRHPTGA